MTSYTVEALCTGKPDTLPDGKRSAIAKKPVDGPVVITRLGLAGDSQVDKRHHGGPDMAVHLYPLRPSLLAETIGDHPALDEFGAFGSNLAVERIDETEVRLGQRFRLGSALLEVCQPRMPCATIERRFERSRDGQGNSREWPLRLVFPRAGRRPGKAGDMLEPVCDGDAPATIAEIFAALANPENTPSPEFLSALANSQVLGTAWRRRALKRLGTLGQEGFRSPD